MKIGGAYTFASLDNESYENIQLMSLCMQYEGVAGEMASRKTQFYQGDLR